MTEHQPMKLEGGEESRLELEGLADVLDPLEQIVLAADQELGSIRERVDSESGEMSTRIESRVREAAREQRQRVSEARQGLIDHASELATRFDAMLKMLNQAERELAQQAGEESTDGVPEVQVTVTERQRLTISHEGPPPAQQPPTKSPVLESSPARAAPRKKEKGEKGIRRWFRRRRRSAA